MYNLKKKFYYHSEFTLNSQLYIIQLNFLFWIYDTNHLKSEKYFYDLFKCIKILNLIYFLIVLKIIILFISL